jgi:putative NAD(P)-binding protein
MNIVVFGATGMIGTRIAAELKQRGHAVTAATRATGADVTDPPSVASVAAGADAVVSAVSARGTSYTLADVAPALVEGMREAGVRRLLVVGGASSPEVAPGMRLLDTPDSPKTGGLKRSPMPRPSTITAESRTWTGPSPVWQPSSIPASAPVATGSAAISLSSTATATARSAPRTTRSRSPICSKGAVASANGSPSPGNRPNSPAEDPRGSSDDRLCGTPDVHRGTRIARPRALKGPKRRGSVWADPTSNGAACRHADVCRPFVDGETRTRTGDTTIFSRGPGGL